MADDRGRAGRALARAQEALRAADVNPSNVSALRWLRRALPGDSGFGDPLSAAGQGGAGSVARLADRLFDDRPRASRELSLGALQVWQATLERLGRGRGNEDVALLFTDLVGFSDWVMQAGDDEALTLLREVAKAQEKAVTAHRGQVVKRLGDGLMAVFPSPRLAFDAVCTARERLAKVEVDGYRPRIRAGLHVGRPRRLGGDYLGLDVNIAARLVEKAGDGETLVTEGVLDRLDQSSVSARRKKTFQIGHVKGVPAGLPVYAISPR